MHTAEVRIAADDDFGARLKDMRLWLDEHRFEPSTFTYLDLNPWIRTQVSSNVADEAQAFAQRFGGFLKYRTVDSFPDGFSSVQLSHLPGAIRPVHRTAATIRSKITHPRDEGSGRLPEDFGHRQFPRDPVGVQLTSIISARRYLTTGSHLPRAARVAHWRAGASTTTVQVMPALTSTPLGT
jgi:hypothetical protein